jgi:hypothetical protein
VEGEASQTNTVRWEDYATTAMDPTDDCTFWYVGDYLKKDATSYSSRIGSFCVVQNSGGRDLRFWSGSASLFFWSQNNGKSMLYNLDPVWWTLINVSLYLVNADGSRFTISAASTYWSQRRDKDAGRLCVLPTCPITPLERSRCAADLVPIV